MPIETLWIDSFSATIDNWQKVGATPYLDAQDYPANYMYNTGLSLERAYAFGFQDSIYTDKIINSVTLKVYCKMMMSEASNKYLNFALWLPGAGTVYPLLLSNSWVWRTADVTAKLDTWAKINAILGDLGGMSSSLTTYTDDLVIDGFVNVTSEWVTVGSSPWLSIADFPTAYIVTSSDGAIMTDFTFADLSALGLLSSIYLWVYCKTDGNEELIPHISSDGGSSWNALAAKVPGGSFQYLSWDLSAYLDTLTKINDARVKFEYNKVGGATNVYIDYAYIRVVHKNYTLVDAAKLEIDWSEPVVARAGLNLPMALSVILGGGR